MPEIFRPAIRFFASLMGRKSELMGKRIREVSGFSTH
jgi:hypothetical protein